MEKYGTAGQATNDNIIRCMRFACCITKATDTHSESVKLLTCRLQQWLRELASVLSYRYIVRLVVININFHPKIVTLCAICYLIFLV